MKLWDENTQTEEADKDSTIGYAIPYFFHQNSTSGRVAKQRKTDSTTGSSIPACRRNKYLSTLLARIVSTWRHAYDYLKHATTIWRRVQVRACVHSNEIFHLQHQFDAAVVAALVPAELTKTMTRRRPNNIRRTLRRSHARHRVRQAPDTSFHPPSRRQRCADRQRVRPPSDRHSPLRACYSRIRNVLWSEWIRKSSHSSLLWVTTRRSKLCLEKIKPFITKNNQ